MTRRFPCEVLVRSQAQTPAVKANGHQAETQTASFVHTGMGRWSWMETDFGDLQGWNLVSVLESRNIPSFSPYVHDWLSNQGAFLLHCWFLHPHHLPGQANWSHNLQGSPRPRASSAGRSWTIARGGSSVSTTAQGATLPGLFRSLKQLMDLPQSLPTGSMLRRAP